MKNKDIAAEVGTDRLTVARWRRRFAEGGLAGIEKDEPRGGRKPTRRNKVARLIVERTTQTVPTNATQKHPEVKSWLKRHRRFHMHFIPTASSWLNLIERWFREITLSDSRPLAKKVL